MNAYNAVTATATATTTTTTTTTPAILPTRKVSDMIQLVSLSIGIPKLEVNDPKAAADLAADKGVAKGRIRVPKKLVLSPHLDACTQIEREARAYLTSKTAQYDRGRDMLLNDYIIDVVNTVRSYFQQLEQHRDAFLQDYPAQVARAQLELGDMFDETEYPPVDELRRKFRWSFIVEPMPSGDMRGNLEDGLRKELADMYEQSMATRMQAAMQDIWQRLLKPLTNMSTRLVDKENGKPTGFHDTLVQNVLEIVEIMQAYNIAEDSTMEDIRLQLRAALDGVTSDALKASATLRAQTKQKIDTIIDSINKIPSLGW